jgi:glycosyltransferase involved in cell wall biosynthesis
MVKVCYIVDNLNIGGLEKVAIDIILSLKGYECQVWCLKEKGVLAGELEAKGILMREFNFEGGLSFASVKKLVRELKKEKFSIIHSHGLFPSVWARVAAIFAGIPVRIDHCHSTYYGLCLKDRIKLRLLSFYTTAIVTVSQAAQKSLIYIGIPRHKIKVIYNGIDDIALDKAGVREKVRAALGLAGDDFVIACLGRLVAMKGQRYLIEALIEVRKRHVRCKCLIIGDGPERERLQNQVKKLGLDGVVYFLGLRRDIPDLLSAAELLIVPSVLREGLPLVLIEAEAMSLPILATDIGGIPEVVERGGNGFVVEPGNAGALAGKILYLIEHPEQLRSMARRSREIWESKFTKAEMMGNIEQFYREMLSLSNKKV